MAKNRKSVENKYLEENQKFKFWIKKWKFWSKIENLANSFDKNLLSHDKSYFL